MKKTNFIFLRTSVLCAVCAFFTLCSAAAQTSAAVSAQLLSGLFNSKVSAEDIQKLAAGEIVVRNIGNARNIGIEGAADNVSSVIKDVNSLKPAYLAEIIKIPGVKQTAQADSAHTVSPAEIAQILESILLRVESFAGIQHWSIRNKTYYDLYSSVRRTADRSAGGKMDIDAVIEMMPFGEFGATLRCERSGSQVMYSMVSTTDMFYKGIKAVSAGKFRVYICMFEYNGIPVLYGIGGVNAPVLPFVKERIEVSFISKNTTFCTFVFSEVEKRIQGER